MGLKRWFRRKFIVPAAARQVDKKLGLKKGTTMNILRGWMTIIAATGALLTAIAAFANGTIGVEALMMAIWAWLTALGVRRAIANVGKP